MCLLQFCRAVISLVVGVPLGLLPGVLTALGIIAITLVRYPLNLYKTFRVTIMTALLKKRLKFLILVSLTIIQILYPVIAVIVAIVVSVVGWCGACVLCVFTPLDQNICKLFSKMPKLLKEYWKFHEKFYNNTLEHYNHPTGVPINWDGRRYDLPEFGFRKTVMGLILTLYGIVVMALGSTIILVLKYPPIHLKVIYHYLKWCEDLCTCRTFAMFPFWLVGIPLVLGLGPILLIIAILISPLTGLRCPYIAIKHNMNIMHGFRDAFVMLSLLDVTTQKFGWNFQLLPKVLPSEDEWTPPPADALPASQKYWGLFVKSCQQVSRDCIRKGWTSQDDHDSCMPNVIQAIPAMAIVAILLRSVKEEPEKQSIHWEEGERCSGETCRNDNLAEFFWPKLMALRKQLKRTNAEEQGYLTAKLCSNSEEVPQVLSDALEEAGVGEARMTQLHRLCGDVNNLVIVLLRMEQMQSRMSAMLDVN